MHIPASDRGADDSEWRTFVEAHAFGHLVAAGIDREVPVVVPTQFLLDGDRVLLHLAAPNPIFEALAEQPRVVLSIAGDWAFIPSAWKAIGAEDPALGIPTTYYAAVQLEGAATVSVEPATVASVLRRQLSALQPEVPGVASSLQAVDHRPAMVLIDIAPELELGPDVVDADGDRPDAP